MKTSHDTSFWRLSLDHERLNMKDPFLSDICVKAVDLGGHRVVPNVEHLRKQVL